MLFTDKDVNIAGLCEITQDENVDLSYEREVSDYSIELGYYSNNTINWLHLLTVGL